MTNPVRSVPVFSQTITDFWREQFLNGDVLYSDGTFTVAINPVLDEDSRVMVLETSDGRVMAVLTPALADKIGLSSQQSLSESIFRQKLNEAGVTLHGADYLFYFSKAEKNVLLQENLEGDLRRLTVQDESVFSAFASSASEQDLDDAYVELDHWAVFGSFEQNRLVSVASMYPWEEETEIADLGVLTLTSFRGKGHARKVVRSICKYAYGQGYEPQYRCQLDNHTSTALAKAAGFTLFGKWEVISPDCME
ncbi:GNAT family N-acetyltransferase [Brevibacillus sp. Leaf182]|uniref:GNAT family N-acetyltransferase n=1 Tax=Brevibacillus sp. Leaf182 TaxID=1736290 RepID=UPI0006F44731|nr:GNAT family N-acetyltransferase [Brevibacillus sp. Leaf182]RAT94099.1 GNAT family N-acetyltransferase [Brevibacillus sp. Leaf182]